IDDQMLLAGGGLCGPESQRRAAAQDDGDGDRAGKRGKRFHRKPEAASRRTDHPPVSSERHAFLPMTKRRDVDGPPPPKRPDGSEKFRAVRKVAPAPDLIQ